MSTSLLETVADEFETKLATIISGATFRNTVAKVYQDIPEGIPEYPSLIFLMGQSTIRPQDDAWSVYQLFVDFFIVCEIQAETSQSTTSNLRTAQETLVHDIMRCIADLYTENVHASSGPRWNIEADPPVKFTPVFPTGQNTGEFTVWGTLRIRNLDASFDGS